MAMDIFFPLLAWIISFFWAQWEITERSDLKGRCSLCSIETFLKLNFLDKRKDVEFFLVGELGMQPWEAAASPACSMARQVESSMIVDGNLHGLLGWCNDARDEIGNKIELWSCVSCVGGSASYGSYNIGSNTKNSVRPLVRQKEEGIVPYVGIIQKTISTRLAVLATRLKDSPFFYSLNRVSNSSMVLSSRLRYTFVCPITRLHM